MDNLKSTVTRAWERGRGIDLGGVGYGRAHWGDQKTIHHEAAPYYFMLAGLAAELELSSCVEIGTHWGGSAVAIAKGMQDAGIAIKDNFITIDITMESDNYLPIADLGDGQKISKIVGDANTPDVIDQVRASLPKAEFLYIDADHSFRPTLMNFLIYKEILRPRVAVFDDIMLSEGMRDFWRYVVETYPGQTINCSDVIPQSRLPECGFGLWVCDAP